MKNQIFKFIPNSETIIAPKDIKIGDKVVVQPGTVKDYNDNADRNINYSNTYGIVGETEDGVQAEYVNLPEYNLSMMPVHLTFEEASSMKLVFMTAYQMLVTRGCLKKHETILKRQPKFIPKMTQRNGIAIKLSVILFINIDIKGNNNNSFI